MGVIRQRIHAHKVLDDAVEFGTFITVSKFLTVLFLPVARALKFSTVFGTVYSEKY